MNILNCTVYLITLLMFTLLAATFTNAAFRIFTFVQHIKEVQDSCCEVW